MKIGDIASLAKAEIEGNAERVGEIIHAEALDTEQQITEIEYDLVHGMGEDYGDPSDINRELNLRIFRALDVLWRLDDGQTGPILPVQPNADGIVVAETRALKIPGVARPLALDRSLLSDDYSEGSNIYGPFGQVSMGLRTRLGSAGIVGWNPHTGPQRRLLANDGDIDTIAGIAKNQREIGTISPIVAALGYSPRMALFHATQRPK